MEMEKEILVKESDLKSLQKQYQQSVEARKMLEKTVEKLKKEIEELKKQH